MPPSKPEFNPNSFDAILGKILEQLTEAKSERIKTNDKLDTLIATLEPRIQKLEQEQVNAKRAARNRSAAIALGVTAGANLVPVVIELFKHH